MKPVQPVQPRTKRIAFLATISTAVLVANLFAALATAANAPVTAKKGTSKPQVLRFDSLTITGDAAKPQVYYLLNRKTILFRHEPAKKDLIGEIQKTIEGEPF